MRRSIASSVNTRQKTFASTIGAVRLTVIDVVM
jgi:hypothetical protein